MVNNQLPPIKKPKISDEERKTISVKGGRKTTEEDVGLAAAEERVKNAYSWGLEISLKIGSSLVQ